MSSAGAGGSAVSPSTSFGGSAIRGTTRSPSVESASVAGASVVSGAATSSKKRRRGVERSSTTGNIGGKRGGSVVNASAAGSVTGAAADGTDTRSLVSGRPGSAGGSVAGRSTARSAGGGRAGTVTGTVGADEGDEEDDDGAGLVDTVMEGGGKMDEASVKQEKEHLRYLPTPLPSHQSTIHARMACILTRLR